MSGTVHVIGVNDDGPAGLPPAVLRRIEEAELLFGGERHLAFFPASKARKTVVKSNLKELAQRIQEQLGRKRIVVLASGDPLFHGIGKVLASRLGPEALEVIPAPSAMQLAFARAAESWEDAALVSVHGKPLEGLDGPAREASKLGIFTDERNSPAAIAAYLRGLGCGDFRAVVCENLGGKDERLSRYGSLEELAKAEAGPLNVLILLRKGEEGAVPPAPDPSRVPAVGIPDGMFVVRQPRKGLITKVEVRVVSLARLALRPGDTVWDVGAGSGSVTVESARLVGPSGRVFAIEKNREDFELIATNLERFGVANASAVNARAPEGLEGFAAPDAVFVGGSGGELKAILDLAKARLKPGGRIVVNAITAETFADAAAWFKASGLAWEMTMLNVSRSSPILEMTRFEALNPIFVLGGVAR